MTIQPGARHGIVCARLVHALCTYVDRSGDSGRVLCNHSGVIINQKDNVVRGPDVAFYSAHRWPLTEPAPTTYARVAPDAVFEVLMPAEHWKEVLQMVKDYQAAEVSYVCIIDPNRKNVVRFEKNQPETTLEADGELTLPILPGFRLEISNLLR